MRIKLYSKLASCALAMVMVSSAMTFGGNMVSNANPNEGLVEEVYGLNTQQTAESETYNQPEAVSNDVELKAGGYTGWKFENEYWYYYKDGKNIRGWVIEGNKTYYMLNTLKRAESMWRKINGQLYYFKGDGSMAQSETLKIDGRYYTFNEEGHITSNPIVEKKKDTPKVPSKQLEAIIQTAKAQLGKSYVWGATGPNTFDCSGLMQYSYRVGGGISIPRVSRDQAKVGEYVSRSELQPGDLVFFGHGNYISHVGMYVGDDKYIHAPQPGDVVKISKLSGTRTITQRRIIKSKNGIYTENGKRVYYENDAKTEGWVTFDGNWYYADKDGVIKTKTWLFKNGGKVYVNSYGLLLKEGTYTIGGKQYTFDLEGRLVG